MADKKRRHDSDSDSEEKKHLQQLQKKLGYTDEDNPFGDRDLAKPFVWKKKEEKGVGAEFKSPEQRIAEIEKLKVQRLQREAEKRARLEQRDKDARELAVQTSDEDWEKFELTQMIKRTEIRIKEGRPTPVDVFFNNMEENTKLQAGLSDPSKYFDKLGIAGMEGILREMIIFQRHKPQAEFWQAMIALCRVVLEDAKKQKQFSGVHAAVDKDITDMLRGKTHAELTELEASIKQQLDSGAALDVEYWETVLKALQGYKLRAAVAEKYQAVMVRKLRALPAVEARYLRLEFTERDREWDSIVTPGTGIAAAAMNVAPAIGPAAASASAATPAPASASTAKGLVPAGARPLAPASGSDLPPDSAAAISELQREAEKLKQLSASMGTSSWTKTNNAPLYDEQTLFKLESSKHLGEGEETFNQDIPLPDNNGPPKLGAVPLRKPLFFNRVKMGYEWNKYNQVHYDADNPPPKQVHGYRFNIFYPDLINKNKPPGYQLIPETEDTVIIRFTAGPPYQDIAFRIVQRDWERSQRDGFKCSFERGVLHLWFNLKRLRYRR